MKKILVLLITLVIIGGGFFYKDKFIFKNQEKVISKKEDRNLKDDGIFFKYYDEALNKVKEMSLEEKVGQIFLVRYDKDLASLYNEKNPGGYILFAKDFSNHTKESIKSEIKSVQENSKYPLIMGVDEEGGIVTRVSRFTNFRDSRFLSNQDIYKQGGFDLLEEVEKEKSSLLLSLGLNLNLAPVADVSTDSNDFIYSRSFGQDATKTASFIKKMVGYSKNNKIGACLKHFPGYGNNVDTHTGIAIDNRSYDTFLNSDYLPFMAGIEEGVPCVLVSHNIVMSMDSEYPASLSKKVHEELRRKLKFSGLIITDDLSMGAISSYVSDGKAATLAINSLNDMIITSNFIEMYNEVLSNVKSGIIEKEVLDAAVVRITAYKMASGLY